MLGRLIGGEENFARTLASGDVTIGSTAGSQSADADAPGMAQAYQAAVASALQAANAPGALAIKMRSQAVK